MSSTWSYIVYYHRVALLRTQLFKQSEQQMHYICVRVKVFALYDIVFQLMLTDLTKIVAFKNNVLFLYWQFVYFVFV